MSRCCVLEPETAFSIIWFFILITVAFPIAFICAPLYIILSPLSGCYPDTCECVADILLCGVQLPYRCVEGIAEGNRISLFYNSCEFECWLRENCEPKPVCCTQYEKPPKKKKQCCCDPPERKTCCHSTCPTPSPKRTCCPYHG